MNRRSPAILILEGEQRQRPHLKEALQSLNVEILTGPAEAKALRSMADPAVARCEICVVIINAVLSDVDAGQLVNLLYSRPQTAHLPLIWLDDPARYQEETWPGSKAGASEIVSPQVSAEILQSKIQAWVDLCRQRHELEGLIAQLDTMNVDLSRQALHLETSAAVSRQITSILDVDQLLIQVVELIRDRFGYYFVGVWMLDEAETSVVLHTGQYGTSQPIREPGPAIPVDTPQSIIAHVYRTGEPYLANDVDTDPLYLPTESLPHIHSELALPLRHRDTVMGVLDLQSARRDAFAPEDVTSLSALAGQIAVAIRNARLYAETRDLNEALEAQVLARTAELETAYEQLKLLDRDKTDFMTIVSHELRTPLTLINGFSKLLIRAPEIQNKPDLRQQVAGIVSGANRLGAIVDSMLQAMKIDSRTLDLHLERLSLAHLLQALIRRFRSILQERRLTLMLEDLSDLPLIEADYDALTRALEELLYNAIKATPDGGTITISGRQLTGEREGQPMSGYVEITVSDTGIGIAPELQELIFAKFYRTGETTLHSSSKTRFKGGGPGLGLAITRGIVEAHGGHIWAESSGHDEVALPGSELHMIFPIDQPDRDQMPQSSPPNEGRPAPEGRD